MALTPEQFRQHVCGRKVPFQSRAEARTMGRITNNGYGGGQVAPYRCPLDDHWHLGHSMSKKQRRARRAS